MFGDIPDGSHSESKELCLNVVPQTLSHQDVSVKLAKSEVNMLVFLALRYPDAAEYHELMEHIGLDLESSRKNTLETFVSRLRQKLAPIEREYLTIKNVRNMGYKLSSAITVRNERY